MQGVGRREVVVGAVLLVAAVVRLVGLGHPSDMVWDERYYAFDAYALLGGTPDLSTHPETVAIPNEQTWEHPPLAKELITIGIGPLGLRPIGWRLMPALSGILGVVLLFAIARELGLEVGWAALATLAVALDGISIVSARVAMLDVFGATFCLAALFLALVWRRTEDRRTLVAFGVMTGAAVASKWAVLPVLVAAIALVVQLAWRRGRRELVWAAAACSIVPALTYLVAYGPFWAYHGWDFSGFARLQGAMLHHQASNHAASPEQSAPLTWPLLLHPIRYYPERGRPVAGSEVLALGNPALWAAFLVALPWAVRSARRGSAAAIVGLAGYLLTWGVWLLSGRTKFLYYMTPAVPFMALTVVAALAGLTPPRRRFAAASFAVGVTVAGIAFLPMWTALPLPPWADRLRWLHSWI